MNVFELLPRKNPRRQKVTDHPSEDQKTKPYEVLTSSKWPGLFQRDRFQHSFFETEWFLRCSDFADEFDQLILCEVCLFTYMPYARDLAGSGAYTD